MCFVDLPSAMPHKASHDIPVFKICRLKENNVIAKYHDFLYKPKTLNEQITLKPYIHYDHIVINSGYHSYKNLVKISAYWHKCNDIEVLTGDNEILAEFIIPKGTLYYANFRGELVSENIIFTGKYYKLLM